MHITLRGLRVVHVGIICPILGKVLFQISFSNYVNILAHNTVLVTSGNSGLHRLNSSLKSSDIPLPTQSPIWVNPMGPITLSFGKKLYNVTTCKLAAQNVLSFLPHRLRSLHQDTFLIWLINNQHSVPTGIHVNETCSQQNARVACTQWSAWRCAQFDIKKPAPVAAVQ